MCLETPIIVFLFKLWESLVDEKTKQNKKPLYINDFTKNPNIHSLDFKNSAAY